MIARTIVAVALAAMLIHYAAIVPQWYCALLAMLMASLIVAANIFTPTTKQKD